MGQEATQDQGLASLSQIAILIPVLGRPERVLPLRESIALATAVEHRALFLASPYDDEELDALEAARVKFHVCPPWPPAQGQYAKKINLGYRITDEPWILCGADDLEFEIGWDEAALALGEQTAAGVVGTNDTAHPLVQSGAHATHPLVRRTYISEESGGAFDGSGDIYCEHYDHQWIDNEFIDTARRRGRFVFAPNSVVRHTHPHWGTAAMDATYELAMRNTEEDRLLYIERLQEIRLIERGARRRAVQR